METDTPADAAGRFAPPAVPFAEACRVWAKIGLLSFGGPAGQIALMHRVLVEEKRWIDEQRFLHALNFCMLLPGPEAQQLATYVGWMLHRVRGGLIAGTLFVLPGSAVVMALSFLYFTAGDLTLVQGLFEGLKPAVVVIVLEAMLRIAGRSLRTPALAALAAGTFLAMFVFGVPFPIVIAAAAAAGALGARFRSGPPSNSSAIGEPEAGHRSSTLKLAASFLALWLAPPALLLAAFGPDDVFAAIGVFFSKMAVVTFGGAYAVLAYVSQEAVATFGWLTAGEMIDGLALAETTPGPLILVTQFVGFAAAYRDPGSLPPLLAGTLGGLLTTWVTFVPCFLWIFIGAPHLERLRRNRTLSAALAAVTAAVVGVVLNLAVWFSFHVLFGEVRAVGLPGLALELPVPASLDLPAVLISLVAAALVFRFRASVLQTLAAAGALGIMASFL
jgi:chromate transporter